MQGFESMGWIIRAFLGTFSGWFSRLVQGNLNVNIMRMKFCCEIEERKEKCVTKMHSVYVQVG